MSRKSLRSVAAKKNCYASVLLFGRLFLQSNWAAKNSELSAGVTLNPVWVKPFSVSVMLILACLRVEDGMVRVFHKEAPYDDL